MTEKITAAESIAGVLAKVKAVGKDSRNQQQGFNFRGIDAVMNAVHPALREVGGFIVPTVLSTEYVEAGTTKNGAAILSCRVAVTYAWHGTDGGAPIAGTVAAEANDMADKATAKAMSVAYRTFLLQTLCLPTDDPDPDAEYIERQQSPRRDWNADLEAKRGDVQALRVLWSEAKTAGAPVEYLDKVSMAAAEAQPEPGVAQ